MHKTVILLAFVGALLLGGKAMAASVTLGWNPSSSTGVNGYYIYYGTSTNNFIPVPVYGTNVTISGLATGQTYYFAAAAFGTNWVESSLSPIISATIGSVIPAGGALSALTGLPAGQFGFTLSGAANTQYIVEGSTDLVNWVALQTNTGSFQFIDSNTTQYPRRFYRTISTSN
jgi:hypothetical protein